MVAYTYRQPVLNVEPSHHEVRLVTAGSTKALSESAPRVPTTGSLRINKS